MTIKDYYSILEVTPSASPLVIKKAYRRLAQKYHPDKNGGNQMFDQKFKEINEAYRILSDNKKRNDYNYSRFERQHNPPPKTDEPPSLRVVLIKAKKLKTFVVATDPERMNKLKIFEELREVLSREHLNLFLHAKDEKANIELINIAMIIARNLPYNHVQTIISKLVKLAGTNNDLMVKIWKFEHDVKYRSLWNEYKLVVVLMVVTLFCLLIYFV